jgi:hypothetical protein
MKKEYDFSKGVRGKFYRKGIELRIPVYVNPRTHENLERLAVKKGKPMEQVVNQLIRKEMKAIR